MNAILSKSILSAAAILSLAVAAFPSTASAGEVHNRVNRQQARIDQGVKSGQLTNREYNHDEARLDSINAQRDRDLAKNDGHLTAGEKLRLNQRLNNSSRDIYFTKHNLAHQPGAPTR